MKSVLKKYIPYDWGSRLRGLWQKSQSIYYYGNNYSCPFCNNSFRKFLPGGTDLPINKEKHIIGAGRRDNMLCPRCYSTDRDRLIYLYIQHKTDTFKQPKKVLHVAPSGSLRALFSRAPNIEHYGGAKYQEGFYYNKDMLIIDITDLKFEDNEFDIIFCNHVLEHVPEDEVAMSELHRVMKPGGWGILQVPISYKIKTTYENPDITDPKGREEHFGQFDHVRIYGSDYFTRLENAGFKVERLSPTQSDWGIEKLEQYSVNPEEELFVVSKLA